MRIRRRRSVEPLPSITRSWASVVRIVSLARSGKRDMEAGDMHGVSVDPVFDAGGVPIVYVRAKSMIAD